MSRKGERGRGRKGHGPDIPPRPGRRRRRQVGRPGRWLGGRPLIEHRFQGLGTSLHNVEHHAVDPAGNAPRTVEVVNRPLDGGVLARTLFRESIHTIIPGSVLLQDLRGCLRFGKVALDLLENDGSRGTRPEDVVELVPQV